MLSWLSVWYIIQQTLSTIHMSNSQTRYYMLSWLSVWYIIQQTSSTIHMSNQALHIELALCPIHHSTDLVNNTHVKRGITYWVGSVSDTSFNRPRQQYTCQTRHYILSWLSVWYIIQQTLSTIHMSNQALHIELALCLIHHSTDLVNNTHVKPGITYWVGSLSDTSFNRPCQQYTCQTRHYILSWLSVWYIIQQTLSTIHMSNQALHIELALCLIHHSTDLVNNTHVKQSNEALHVELALCPIHHSTDLVNNTHVKPGITYWVGSLSDTSVNRPQQYTCQTRHYILSWLSVRYISQQTSSTIHMSNSQTRHYMLSWLSVRYIIQQTSSTIHMSNSQTRHYMLSWLSVWYIIQQTSSTIHMSNQALHIELALCPIHQSTDLNNTHVKPGITYWVGSLSDTSVNRPRQQYTCQTVKRGITCWVGSLSDTSFNRPRQQYTCQTRHYILSWLSVWYIIQQTLSTIHMSNQALHIELALCPIHHSTDLVNNTHVKPGITYWVGSLSDTSVNRPRQQYTCQTVKPGITCWVGSLFDTSFNRPRQQYTCQTRHYILSWLSVWYIIQQTLSTIHMSNSQTRHYILSWLSVRYIFLHWHSNYHQTETRLLGPDVDVCLNNGDRIRRHRRRWIANPHHKSV